MGSGISKQKPKAAGYCTYREQDACAPTKGEEVEGAELARLIELAVFGFGEVLLPVDFLQRWPAVNNTEPFLTEMTLTLCLYPTYVQHILLDNGMHYDSHQHVEEDSCQVLDPVVEVVHGSLLWCFCSTQKSRRVKNQHPSVIDSHPKCQVRFPGVRCLD